ncbi:MAG: potassium/proton antiporter [Euryarchaeota archaeon]|nr:potassium/proton antiporter [Euryarchaeota archaeon]
MLGLQSLDSLYLIAALILLVIVLTARLAHKWQLPLIIIALGIGILFGSDVTGLVYLDDAVLVNRLANLALIFVLFFAGFSTKRVPRETILVPSLALATAGVLLTAVLTGVVLWALLGLGFSHALLIGCIISSTDAAAVFSILRARSLNRRTSSITEMESATNDPMAIVLTTAVILFIAASVVDPLRIGASIVWQLAAGIGVGLLVGKLGCFLFDRIKVIDRGYFYIFMIGLVLLSYSFANLVYASGMLAVFFAGNTMGISNITHKSTLSNFLDALSTIANAGIFVLMGLLAFPGKFGAIWLQGLVLFLALTFIARPAAVFALTAFSGLGPRQKAFISWAGLRGAVPLVLATYPVAAGIPGSGDIFSIVFFAVLLSLLVQGSTIGKMADWLGLTERARPRPTQSMELVTVHTSDLQICELEIDEDLYEGSVGVSDLHLPAETTITMINRSDDLIAPSGQTKILPGDVLYVLVKNFNIEKMTSEIVGHFKRKEAK